MNLIVGATLWWKGLYGNHGYFLRHANHGLVLGLDLGLVLVLGLGLYLTDVLPLGAFLPEGSPLGAKFRAGSQVDLCPHCLPHLPVLVLVLVLILILSLDQVVVVW